MIILRIITFLVACLIAPIAWAQGLSHGAISPGTGPRDAPIDVSVGIMIDQISFVNQKSENYGAVVTIRAEWHDPALAFDPVEFGRDYRLMRPEKFIEHVYSLPTIAPGFVVQNQQSNRWIHQSAVVVHADGTAKYVEKSSLTLQAPHFNFTRYPFDNQTFYFEVVSMLPTALITYSPMEEVSGLGSLLGEEEWILENATMEVSTEIGISGRESSKIALKFEGRRHIMYYAIRILLPMLVLVVVSWSTFFLNDYRKRIEIAGANLLMFIAFNWVISDDLPRLGYLTFLDFIMQFMFLVTGAIIVFNVGLLHMKQKGREASAVLVDTYVTRWLYPVGYLAIIAFAVSNYLLIG
jgi:hypothetical protein